MNEEEIQVRGLELIERVFKRAHHAVKGTVRSPDFARNKEIVAGKAGVVNRSPDRAGIGVDLSGVELAVPELNGGRDGAFERGVVGDLPGSEAYAGNLNAVAELKLVVK